MNPESLSGSNAAVGTLTAVMISSHQTLLYSTKNHNGIFASSDSVRPERKANVLGVTGFEIRATGSTRKRERRRKLGNAICIGKRRPCSRPGWAP